MNLVIPKAYFIQIVWKRLHSEPDRTLFKIDTKNSKGVNFNRELFQNIWNRGRPHSCRFWKNRKRVNPNWVVSKLAQTKYFEYGCQREGVLRDRKGAIFFYQGRKKSAGVHRERNKSSLKKKFLGRHLPGTWFLRNMVPGRNLLLGTLLRNIYS